MGSAMNLANPNDNRGGLLVPPQFAKMLKEMKAHDRIIEVTLTFQIPARLLSLKEVAELRGVQWEDVDDDPL